MAVASGWHNLPVTGELVYMLWRCARHPLLACCPWCPTPAPADEVTNAARKYISYSHIRHSWPCGKGYTHDTLVSINLGYINLLLNPNLSTILRGVETHSPEGGIVSNRWIAYNGEYFIGIAQIAHHWFRDSIFRDFGESRAFTNITVHKFLSID